MSIKTKIINSEKDRKLKRVVDSLQPKFRIAVSKKLLDKIPPKRWEFWYWTKPIPKLPSLKNKLLITLKTKLKKLNQMIIKNKNIIERMFKTINFSSYEIKLPKRNLIPKTVRTISVSVFVLAMIFGQMFFSPNVA